MSTDRQGNLCEVVLVMEDLSESDKYWEGRDDSECRYPEDVGFRWRKDVQGQVSGEKQGCSEERMCLRCVEEAIPFA